MAKRSAVRCPGCSGAVDADKAQGFGFGSCRACGGSITYTPVWAGESYGAVKPFFCPHDPAPEATRYFDHMTLGSKGLERRHGFFHADNGCRQITQVG